MTSSWQCPADNLKQTKYILESHLGCEAMIQMRLSRERKKRTPGKDLCGTPIFGQQKGRKVKISRKVYFSQSQNEGMPRKMG